MWFFWPAGSKHLTLEINRKLMLINAYYSLFKFIQTDSGLQYSDLSLDRTMVAECCLDCTCAVVLKGAPLSLGTKFENHDVQFEYALSLPKALCPNSKNKEFTVSIRHVYQILST